MKCQGMTWEGMKRCSSAGASAAVQGCKTLLVLKPWYRCTLAHISPWVKQMLEKENFNITARNVFAFWQHLASAEIRHLGALHFINTYRKRVAS